VNLNAAILPVLLAAACTVGPDYRPPQATVPPTFHEAAAVFTAEAPDLGQWWQRLDDPVLDGLIARASRQNLDLRQAVARLAESRALRGGSAALRWPTLDAQAGYERRSDSENTPFGAFATDFDRFTLGLDSSWEIDLWGRVRRAVEAADADVESSHETVRAVLVSVAAETATDYVQLRAVQERLRIARDNIALQEQTLALVRTRFESGLVGERDVSQAASNLAATRARVPLLEAAQRTAENRLAVLLGLPPGSLAGELSAVRGVPVPPATVAVGVPRDVVRRRPDVRAAERALAAETARIGVAEADLYPRLSLLGSIGLESDRLSDLVDSGSGVLAVGPRVRFNLFDAGAVRSRIAAQGARAAQALVRFEQAVLVALEEAENAMTAFVREQARAVQLAEAATQARAAATFARTQYEEGLTDFQAVLDSERAVAELEDQVAESRASITADLIALYKALGGGWESVSTPQS